MAYNFISFRRSFRKMSVVSMTRRLAVRWPQTQSLFSSTKVKSSEKLRTRSEKVLTSINIQACRMRMAEAVYEDLHCLLFYFHQRFLSCRQPFGGQNFFRCRNAGGAWCWLCVVLLLGCGLLGVCSGEINWSQSAAGEESISSRTQPQTRPCLLSVQNSFWYWHKHLHLHLLLGCVSSSLRFVFLTQ